MELINLKSLEPGTEYIFDHIRKGRFRAKLVRRVQGDMGNKVDHTFLECLIDTEASPRLARAKGAKQTLTNIRPSLLRSIESVPAYVAPASQTVVAPQPAAEKKTKWWEFKK